MDRQHDAESDRIQRQLNRIASATAALTRTDKETVLGENLIPITDLEAYGREVSDKQRASLRAATVKLLKRQKSSTEEWQPSCTAVRVSVNGNSYFATARHCFGDDFASLGKGGSAMEASAVNFSNMSLYDYAISSVRGENEGKPMAYIESASMDITGNDWALMRASENIPGYTDTMPNLKLAPRSRPAAGQEVALYSAPQANNHEAVEATGTYVGRIPAPNTPGMYIDIVGIGEVDSPRLDACNFGSSGSLGLMADGYVTGPLAFRNNISYGDGVPSQEADDPVSAQQNRLIFESQLGVDLSGFTTLCGFSVAETDTLNNLEQGFNLPYEDFLYGPDAK